MSEFTTTAAVQKLLSPRLLSGLVLALCLGLTAVLWHGAREDAERDARAEFDFRVRELVNNIAARMHGYIQILYGAQGLFASSVTVERDEFRTYLERQELAGHFDGMQGVGYMQFVTDAERAKLEEEIHHEGFSAYEIKPAGQRNAYAPVVYIEPFKGMNVLAFGYDSWSEPVRRAALEQSRDSGMPAMTGKITLRQETANQSGFLIVVPVYHNGRPHLSLAQRREAIEGWVYAPFRMGDVMVDILGDRSARLDIEIYDGEETSDAARLYDSTPQAFSAGARQSVQQLSIAGHRWTLRVSSQAGVNGALADKARLIGLGGIVFSALVAALAFALAESRSRVAGALARTQDLASELKDRQDSLRAMADEAQSSQAMLRNILDSTVDGILVDNYRGSVLTSNRRFRQLWNLPEQLDWRNDGATLLAHMATQLEDAQEFTQCSQTRRDADCRLQLQLRDGRTLEQTTRPMRLGLESARLWSFRDITERTQIEQREATRRHLLESLAGGATLQVALESVVEGVETANPSMLCSVMLLDDEGKYLLVGAAPSIPAFFNAAVHGQPVGLGNGSCGKAVLTNSRVIVEDIHNDPLWAPYRELAARAGLGSCWTEPIRSADCKVLGSFAIYHHEPNRPSVAHIALVEQAAHLAGIAIERAQAADALRAGQARFRSLYDNAPVALWEQDWSAVRHALIELESSGVEDVQTWLHHNPSQLERLAALVRITDVNAAALAQVGATAGKKDLSALSLAQICNSTLCFARTLGALSKGAHLFVSESGYLRLDGVARQNELTLLVMPGHEHTLDFVIVSTVDITERKRANEELLVLATTDFLTGLFNRREFMARLDAEHNRLQRDVGGHASVLMLDIDHFKDVNDEYGHPVGDAVLRHLSGLMRDSQRKIDVLGRVGGEEFAVLLPGADLEAAHAFAERLRQRIADTPLLLEGHSFAVTVSVGIAALAPEDMRGDTALGRADKALYAAKRSGRNRVMV
jgi:diguanylate cyclase (GGDEF)-like protein